MQVRLFVPFSKIFLMVFFCAIANQAKAGTADRLTYANCLKAEMEKAEALLMSCSMAGGENPDDPRNSGECRSRAKASFTAEAELKCRQQVDGSFQRQVEGDRPEPTKPEKLPSTNDCGETGTCGKKTPAAQQKTPAGQKAEAKTIENARQAVESAKKTTPQDYSTASSDASSDVLMCENSLSYASRCCGNPEACVGEMSYSDQQNYARLKQMSNQRPQAGSQGLTEYCQQMDSLGSGGSDVNAALAGICHSKQQACSLTCSRLAGKYQQLLSSCNGCESQNIYQNTLDQLLAKNSSCNALSSQISQISNQAGTAGYSGSYGDICKNVGGMGTQSAANSAAQPASASNMAASSDPNACAQNPNSPACLAQAQAVKEVTGTAQMATGGGAKKKDDFNIPSLTETFTGGPGRNQDIIPGAAPSVKTIANNSGGAIPNADGSNAASLGGNARKGGASPGSPGYTTDVMTGFQGGEGYSAQAVPNGSGFEDDQPYVRMGNARRPANAGDPKDSNYLGMDLRKYLPGGSLDPKRRLAGFGRNSEINRKEEIIWEIISSKLVEKCKLGVLLDCK